MRNRALLTAVLTLAVTFATTVPSAEAETVRTPRKPSASQMERLAHLEPFIRYFTSLSYGKNGARISPDYIRALILTESGGEKTALSNKGARGLTQLIPTTAELVARELVEVGYDFLFVDESKLEEFDPDYLYDPAINILMACYLSATYHDKYEGATELVVSAWNAGPGAVSRYGNKPPPYRETRNMIARLTGYVAYLETLD